MTVYEWAPWYEVLGAMAMGALFIGTFALIGYILLVPPEERRKS